MSKIQVLLALLICPLFSSERPNIVVIMVDDLGFSDIGCYGGEIETPNLDRLAANGLRFSQFYNTAKCHSSRVSLLTGQYCIAAGDVALTHAVTSAEVLQDVGYFTAMTGKWHLGDTSAELVIFSRATPLSDSTEPPGKSPRRIFTPLSQMSILP